MKIEELIEMLQEEQKIHPYTDVVFPEKTGETGSVVRQPTFRDIRGIHFNGQQLILQK